MKSRKRFSTALLLLLSLTEALCFTPSYAASPSKYSGTLGFAPGTVLKQELSPLAQKSSNPKKIVLTQKESTTPQQLSTDQEVTISLEANAGTGFIWSYEKEKSTPGAVPFKEIPSKQSGTENQGIETKGFVGAPYHHEWSFRLNHPGEYHLFFSLGRSWESKSQQEIEYTLLVSQGSEDQDPTIVVTQEDNGALLNTTSEKIVIQLSDHEASTGIGWRVAGNDWEDNLTLDSYDYAPKSFSNTAPGAPYQRTWSFIPTSNGQQELTFFQTSAKYPDQQTIETSSQQFHITINTTSDIHHLSEKDNGVTLRLHLGEHFDITFHYPKLYSSGSHYEWELQGDLSDGILTALTTPAPLLPRTWLGQSNSFNTNQRKEDFLAVKLGTHQLIYQKVFPNVRNMDGSPIVAQEISFNIEVTQ